MFQLLSQWKTSPHRSPKSLAQWCSISGVEAG
jgi:hypothetical protein